MRPAVLAFSLIAFLTITSTAPAQKAVRVVTIRPDGAAPTPSNQPAPEKTVVIDPKVAWLAAAEWDGNKPPGAYGYDPITTRPKFTVVDPNAKALWIYRPLVPVDLTKYPILTIKYRATNYNKQAQSVVRLVQGKDERMQAFPVFTGEEVQSDNREHELSHDLREVQAAQPLQSLKNIGLWVETGEQGPATFEIMGISFSAPDDIKNEPPKDDKPVKVFVKDKQDKPLAGVKVTIDAERLNFARTGTTDDKGEVVITPLTNEANVHSARIEKDGIVMSEMPDGKTFTAIASSYYGGTAKNDEGKPIPRAMIRIKGTPDVKDMIGREIDMAIITDTSGRWTAPPLPEDATKLAVELSHLDENQNAVTSALETASLKRSPPLKVVSVPSAGSAKSAGTAAASATTKPAGAAPTPKPPPAVLPNITITKVDDSTVSGSLSSFKDGQLVIAPKPGETLKLPLEDVAELSFKAGGTSSSVSSARISSLVSASTQPGGTGKLKSCTLELTSGDKLLGELVSWADRKLTLKFDGGSSPIQVPIDQVSRIWLASQDQVKKAQGLGESAKDEDVAYAARDNDAVAVRGVAVGLDGGNLLFRFNNEDRKIPVSRLIGVALAHPEQEKQPPQFEQVVTLTGAEQTISGKLIAIGSGQVELTKWDQSIKLPIDKIAKITCRNGRLAYLSDLKPESVEQVPFFDRVYTFKTDKSLDGKPLTIQDGNYPRGLAVHSRSKLTYDLGGRYDEFRAKLGFQQPEGKLGNAAIRVIGDDKVLFEKAEARGDQPAFEIKAPLAGVQKLTIEVDFGKSQDVADRVVWASARVLRSSK